MQKAQEYYDLQEYDVALPLLFDALKQQPKNTDVKMFIARIYAEISQLDLSIEAYASVLADGYNEAAVKGIISNLVCQGNFKDARYYTTNYKLDFDFSDFLTVETDEGDVLYGGDEDDYDEAAEKRKQFRVVVYKKTKDGDNLITKKDFKDMSVEDLQGLSSAGEVFNFRELMDKLLNIDDGELAETEEPRRTDIGFKQVYPVPKKDCETTVKKAYDLFSAGRAEDALALLEKITPDCGKYYYLAQKNKVLCYLSMNRLSSMRTAAQEALKGLPDDYTLKCYYYMAAKLLEEEDEATKLFEEIVAIKPANLMEYMVKMDACRLALNHKGIIECADRVLEDLPYQPLILLLRGKGEYYDGYIKVARATFLEVLRLYPDNFEARTLIRKIDADDGSMMTYGDIELAIKRVKLMSEISLCVTDGRSLAKYFENKKDWQREIEFLLLNESDRNIHTIVSNMAGMLKEVFEKLLLKTTASEYLKLLMLTYYINAHYPKKVAVMAGKKLISVELPRYGWDKNLPEHIIMGADMAMADIIYKKENPKKYVVALTSRLLRVSEYLYGDGADKEIVRELSDPNFGIALKRALEDLATHSVKRLNPMTLQDEKYLTYIKIFEKIEEDYEI